MPLPPDHEPCASRGIRMRDLRAFVAVVRAGSMNRAAAGLGLSQSAISQQIDSLERAIGQPLLDRSHGGIALLPCGKALLPYAEGVLDRVDQGLREVAFAADPGNGEVRIGTSEPFIATGLLGTTMVRIRRQHPRMTLHVTEASAVALELNGLRDRSLDVVLSHMPVPDACEDIATEVLFEDRILAVAGERSTWSQAPAVTLRDLITAPWVLGAPGTAIRVLVDRAFAAERLTLPVEPCSTHSMELRMQLLAEDDYVSSLPISLVRAKGQVWGLRALPVAFGPPVPVVAASLRRRPQTSVLRLFLDHLRAAIAERHGVGEDSEGRGSG